MKEFLNKKRFTKAMFIYLLVVLALSSLFSGITAILKLGIYVGRGNGDSMANTITDGAKLLLSSSDKREIKRGDIVFILAYDYDRNNEKIILGKRVIAMPNETITIKGDKVYINGALLEEPYAHYDSASYDDINMKVPENSYFVMGDNRLKSTDSRALGVVPRESIYGVVIKAKN